jgi:hypothetical protein
MRTELHPWEKAVLGPPHPGDFGIPKEHWEKAQHYANYWHENQVAAQRPSSFAGLTLTEVRVPFGMTVRFEGGALIVEAAQHLDDSPTLVHPAHSSSTC